MFLEYGLNIIIGGRRQKGRGGGCGGPVLGPFWDRLSEAIAKNDSFKLHLTTHNGQRNVGERVRDSGGIIPHETGLIQSPGIPPAHPIVGHGASAAPGLRSRPSKTPTRLVEKEWNAR